jgi:cytochrome c-type biogenesis protein CcmE
MVIKARHKRLLLITIGLVLLGLAATLIVNALKSNMVFFYSPSQVKQGEVPKNTSFRIGGLVVPASLQRGDDGLSVRFAITDTAQTVAVIYHGVLPDLFKEGKGVVAQGQLQANGIFSASEVLAKHDENYMPPEAAAALKQAQPTAANTLLLAE